MRIAFFGHRDTFDYFHIGGFQSFVRRLSSQIIRMGFKVDYILYSAQTEKEVEVIPNLKLKYFKKIEDAIYAMSAHLYDHIIHVRIPSYFVRFKIAFIYKKHLKHIRYHYISFIWSDSWIKRNLMVIEANLNTRNGKIIAVSPRLWRFLKKRTKNVYFILPPVPKDYFVSPKDKPINNKIKISFIGVIYPDKGIDKVIELFKILKDDPKFDCRIYAIYEPRNKFSTEIRDWLKKQKIIKYTEIDRYNYTSEIENFVKKILKETDVFIQPYTSLGATVDTPLLLLEAMASLCAVITTPIGSIPEIYGKSKYFFSPKEEISSIVRFLKNITFEEIEAERQRIFEQNKKLEFELSKVANKFIEILNS